MKKWIIILFLCAFCILTYQEKIESAFIEKIDVNLKKEEIGVLFIPVYNSRFLLIKTREKSILLPIVGEENPKKVLERFGEETPTYSYVKSIKAKENITNENLLKIENITITKQKQNYIISNSYTNFCLFYEDAIPATCDYIYFIKEPKEVEDNIKLAFYNEDMNSAFEKELYDHWIDTYKIKKEECTLFTLHEDSYNVIKLPNYYFRLS